MVELAQVGLIRAKRAVRQISHCLPVLEKLGYRLLHVHASTLLLCYWEVARVKST